MCTWISVAFALNSGKEELWSLNRTRAVGEIKAVTKEEEGDMCLKPALPWTKNRI